MAEAKETFPVISEKAWWALRRRFKASPPTQISNSYLSNLLNITERAAANIRPQLRRIGLITEDGNVEDRAYEDPVRQVYRTGLEGVVGQKHVPGINLVLEILKHRPDGKTA